MSNIIDREDGRYINSGELSFSDQTLEEKIEVHKTLNPKLWDENNELLDKVEEKIYEIVDEFKKQVEEDGVKLSIEDIYILGSNANYNYTAESDVDIHIIADEAFDCKDKHLQIIYTAYKSMFNNKYDITINGLEVEIYVENKDDLTNISTGVYSLKKGWLKDPSQLIIPEIDEAKFEKEVAKWEEKYLEVIENLTIENIDKYIDKLYEVRAAAMKKDGEFAFDNLVFKEIRRLKYIENLRILKLELKNDQLSL